MCVCVCSTIEIDERNGRYTLAIPWMEWQTWNEIEFQWIWFDFENWTTFFFGFPPIVRLLFLNRYYPFVNI